MDSPGFNAGRGLKQTMVILPAISTTDSPGFNAGRGLKRPGVNYYDGVAWIRPVLMPGVD